MRTLRGAIAGAIALLITSTAPAGAAQAAESTVPSAPHTALTMNFDGWGYIDGSFSYEPSRNSLEIYQQNANGYALVMRGFAAENWHYLDVTPPKGTRFLAGQKYQTTTNFSPQDSITVLNISGDGQSCGWSSTPGTIEVKEAAYDDAGRFTAFAATFSVPCGWRGSAKGEIRFQSSIGYKATDTWAYQLQMGAQPAGMRGRTQNVTVEANGTVPTTFGAASLSGTDPGAFEISANTCSGNTLNYGQTCQLSISPKASALGEQSAVLTLVEDSVAGKVTRLLSLTGYDPRDATAAPGYFSFGDVPAYETSAPQTVTLTGASDLPITFGQATLGGDNASSFKITSDGCSQKTLSKGQSCSVTAVARPSSPTQVGALLTLPDNSFAGRTQLSLGVNGYPDDRGTYYPVAPYRIMDTRTGKGAPKRMVGPGGVVSLQVTGSGGVTTEASTVVLNVTVTGPTMDGFVTAYPSGLSRPTASSLNFTKGWTGANSVTVKVGADGKVKFYNHAGSTHIIVDVDGYYSKGHECCSGYMGGQYHPLSKPIRITDTRTWGTGRVPREHYINSAASWGSTINPRVRAFAVSITATQPSSSGFLTAWEGSPDNLPNTSTLNYSTGATVPNFAVVPTTPCANCGSASGWPSIGVYTHAPTHIVVDIVGFYDDGSLPNGLRFQSITPTRIADTRTGQGWPSRLGPGATAAVPTPRTVANVDTWGLATNVTAVKPTSTTVMTVWPSGVPRPNTSSLNPKAGSLVSNAVQTMISQDDKFNVHNAFGYTNFVVDVVGTFNLYPPTPPVGWGSNLTSAAPQPRLGTGRPETATPKVSTAHLVKRI
ncbi:choice-of-anchor D domain-containing protein [Micromonospora sp. CPCC 206171]|uniref:choice-of-anchor D domain-containing protein n=1 Tax=Micromonospora sp. CPCC 206171 TaxID=3122405 RepID=UPI002FF2EECB